MRLTQEWLNRQGRRLTLSPKSPPSVNSFVGWLASSPARRSLAKVFAVVTSSIPRRPSDCCPSLLLPPTAGATVPARQVFIQHTDTKPVSVNSLPLEIYKAQFLHSSCAFRAVWFNDRHSLTIWLAVRACSSTLNNEQYIPPKRWYLPNCTVSHPGRQESS